MAAKTRSLTWDLEETRENKFKVRYDYKYIFKFNMQYIFLVHVT